jgi:hypothetical protein
MKVKIEIDMKPEELQRFLGLPDVGAMREELLDFIKEKVAADPAGFLLNNLDQLRKSRAVRRILYGAQANAPREGGASGVRRDDDGDEDLS